MDAKTIARFWSKVDVCGPDECWPWRAALGNHGYGVLQIGSRRDGSHRVVTAHRVAFFLKHGRWPEPCALHHCDNRPCCNAAHLFEGTQADNNHDMKQKGRHEHGDAHHFSKLNVKQVVELRALCASGISHGEVARHLGVVTKTVRRAVRRQTWAHVP